MELCGGNVDLCGLLALVVTYSFDEFPGREFVRLFVSRGSQRIPEVRRQGIGEAPGLSACDPFAEYSKGSFGCGGRFVA